MSHVRLADAVVRAQDEGESGAVTDENPLPGDWRQAKATKPPFIGFYYYRSVWPCMGGVAR